VRKSEGNSPQGRPKFRKIDDNSKMDLGGMG
jgi:hypothetical protein